MRIALSHHKLAAHGGIEGYVHALACRLVEAGHDVHAFVRELECPPPAGVEVHRLAHPPLPRALDVLHFARSSHRVLAAEPFDVVHGFSYGYHQDVYTEGSLAYRDFLERAMPARPGAIGRFLRTYGLQRRVLEWIERRRYGPRGARRILAMSKLCRDSIAARYPLAAARTEVLYVGVDLARFEPGRLASARERVREQYGVGPDALALIFVGSDYYRKGLATFLRAVARLGGEGLPVHGLVVGYERRRREAAFREEARRLGVADRVHFAGGQREVAPFLAAGDIFLFPSHCDAFGIVVLEALAAGLPVIVSKRAGAFECVRPGVTGEVLEDPRDDEAAASLVRRFAAPEVRMRASQAARQDAARFSFEAHFARLAAIYEELAAERRPTGRASGIRTGLR